MSISPSDADTNVQPIDPLPYFITFAVLFIIFLALFTWVLGVWYKSNQCSIQPNIWCSDNWSCNQNSSDGSPCFLTATGATGLASCLFGPESAIALVCFNAPTGGTGGLACNCPTGMAVQTNNCLSNCPGTTAHINSNTECCCTPGTPGCHNDSSNRTCGGTT